MARWSYTKLRAARTCPEQFFQRFVVKSDNLVPPCANCLIS